MYICINLNVFLYQYCDIDIFAIYISFRNYCDFPCVSICECVCLSFTYVSMLFIYIYELIETKIEILSLACVSTVLNRTLVCVHRHPGTRAHKHIHAYAILEGIPTSSVYIDATDGNDFISICLYLNGAIVVCAIVVC